MFVETVKVKQLWRDLSTFLTFYWKRVLYIIIKSHFLHELHLFWYSSHDILLEISRIVGLRFYSVFTTLHHFCPIHAGFGLLESRPQDWIISCLIFSNWSQFHVRVWMLHFFLNTCWLVVPTDSFPQKVFVPFFLILCPWIFSAFLLRTSIISGSHLTESPLNFAWSELSYYLRPFEPFLRGRGINSCKRHWRSFLMKRSGFYFFCLFDSEHHRFDLYSFFHFINFII